MVLLGRFKSQDSRASFVSGTGDNNISATSMPKYGGLHCMPPSVLFTAALLRALAEASAPHVEIAGRTSPSTDMLPPRWSMRAQEEQQIHPSSVLSSPIASTESHSRLDIQQSTARPLSIPALLTSITLSSCCLQDPMRSVGIQGKRAGS